MRERKKRNEEKERKETMAKEVRASKKSFGQQVAELRPPGPQFPGTDFDHDPRCSLSAEGRDPSPEPSHQKEAIGQPGCCHWKGLAQKRRLGVRSPCFTFCPRLQPASVPGCRRQAEAPQTAISGGLQNSLGLTIRHWAAFGRIHQGGRKKPVWWPRGP